jgi:hypothetical protein
VARLRSTKSRRNSKGPRRPGFPRKKKRTRVRWHCNHWSPRTQAKSKPFARLRDAEAFADRFEAWMAGRGTPVAWIVVEEQSITIHSSWREVPR